ncbi:MAG: SDR family oxidoreductase [Chlamydiae bacterium]|nr:SDR family oxidoreductase [Chlamydiota bacterium]
MEKLIALVTGSGSGIGKAVGIRLAKDGFHVILHYNNNSLGAQDALEQINKMGATAELIKFDITKPNEIEDSLQTLFSDKATRAPYALINNAGRNIDNLTGMMTDGEFDKVIRTNLYGPFYLLRWCVKRMIRDRRGSIVNIASLAGQTGNVGQINYSASKAGLIGMTKSLALELGSRNIRVNAVAPGLIETEMIKDIPGLEDFKTRIPLKRLGTPEEVAGAVSFLCSTDSTYITGHTVNVNGGIFPS